MWKFITQVMETETDKLLSFKGWNVIVVVWEQKLYDEGEEGTIMGRENLFLERNVPAKNHNSLLISPENLKKRRKKAFLPQKVDWFCMYFCVILVSTYIYTIQQNFHLKFSGLRRGGCYEILSYLIWFNPILFSNNIYYGLTFVRN